MSQSAEFIAFLREELQKLSTEQNRITAERFFKHDIRVYGVRSAEVENLGKESFREIKSLGKEAIFAISEELWKSGMMEETFLACRFTYSYKKDFAASDIALFETWIDSYIDNWASCDTFCNHTIGEMLMLFPETRERVKSWSLSTNLWMRRAAAVSYIVPARKGLYLDDIFQIAETMLLDKEDMVQKGYGWSLKVASQKYLEEVFQFVMERRAIMPRTALRYAIEKMPPDYKKEAMAKK
ncbi:MAG: DNA alkylation repair protein [Bacteroidales bacterium]|nr:DNA alkylation repair protein [Bacteroidales bacterium]